MDGRGRGGPVEEGLGFGPSALGGGAAELAARKVATGEVNAGIARRHARVVGGVSEGVPVQRDACSGSQARFYFGTALFEIRE
jgi:hypothetical protein